MVFFQNGLTPPPLLLEHLSHFRNPKFYKILQFSTLFLLHVGAFFTIFLAQNQSQIQPNYG